MAGRGVALQRPHKVVDDPTGASFRAYIHHRRAISSRQYTAYTEATLTARDIAGLPRMGTQE